MLRLMGMTLDEKVGTVENTEEWDRVAPKAQAIEVNTGYKRPQYFGGFRIPRAL